MASIPEFSIRIVTADSYMSKPVSGLDPMYSETLRVPSQRVPIIRVFGSTPAGQAACMHIHGVFPYIYVPYDGSTPMEAYTRQFAASLDHALNLYAADAGHKPKETAGASAAVVNTKQHVFKITIVKGIPFYGYYQHEVMYLKVYFYDAQSIKRAIKVLQNGIVMRKTFQPYEAHIPYILQFFMDYNLQGMNFINVSSCEFRKAITSEGIPERSRLRPGFSEGLESSQHMVVATTYHLPNTDVFNDHAAHRCSTIPRVTTCELEIDVVSDDILNREEIEIKIGTNPGLAAIWRDENQRRALRGLPSVTAFPESQDRNAALPAKSEAYFLRKLETKLQIKLVRTPVEIEVLETVADLVDEVEVMQRDNMLFGISSTTLKDQSVEINSSFYLDHHNVSLFDNQERNRRHSIPALIRSDSIVNELQLQSLNNEVASVNGIFINDANLQKESIKDIITSFAYHQSLDLSGVLRDLAVLADEFVIDGSNRSNPVDILKQDDVDTVEMSRSVLEECHETINLEFPLSQWCSPVKAGVPIPGLEHSEKIRGVEPKVFEKELADNRQLENEDRNCGTATLEQKLFVEPAKKGSETDEQRSLLLKSSVAKTKVRKNILEKSVSVKRECTPRPLPFLTRLYAGGRQLPKKSRDDLVIITPTAPFPTRSEMESTAGQYGLFRNINNVTYFSAVSNLVSDIRPTADEYSNGLDLESLPVVHLEEFGSSCLPFRSATLFESGMKFVDQDPESATTIICPVFPSKGSVKDNVWKVTLTPAILFPNLTSVIRLQARSKVTLQAPGLQNKAANETIQWCSKLGSSVDGQTKKMKVALAPENNFGLHVPGHAPKRLINSAQKAHDNDHFKLVVGNNLGISCTYAKKQKTDKPKLSIIHKAENLVLMSMELQADILLSGCSPDPRSDAIRLVAYTLMSDTGEETVDGCTACIYVDEMANSVDHKAKLVRDSDRFSTWLSTRVDFSELSITCVASEEELLHLLATRVRSLGPDMLVGYEVQQSSWGYFIERGNAFGMDMSRLLSRLLKQPCKSYQRKVPAAVAAYESRKMSELHVIGRVILNVWRLMRKEVTLNIYSFENVVYHVLNLRFHLYSDSTLTTWLKEAAGNLNRWRAFEYCIRKTLLNVNLLTKLDIIRQTSEFSRLFGIQFYETLTRGSQFRVESMMLRLAKPFSFVPVSPSGDQLVGMTAPESLALIMEPESRFFNDPVIVLDFQSLYPSMIIAYNYCYSTCLGRVEFLGSEDYFKFGCTAMKVPPTLLRRHVKDITVSPNGVAFLRSNVRRGILPQMLEEILNTRIMVKKSMGDYNDDPVLKKLLHARQLGLKLIANVTYGYTSASFSGRMPCIEIGDSIVAKARETLELSMKFVAAHPRWNARVVYGDTDSMFVVLRGRSKEEAFRIGREIERAITDMNPKPVKLKFEKVYLPCVLQTKKRYCGYMYETEDQKEPIFDAKGIETVRRDGCVLVSKTLEQVIRILFAPKCDLLSVKQYVQSKFIDVLTGKTNMQDFIFAKEYRGKASYKRGACVPALEIARRVTILDPRAEPRVGERVPYIITYGKPHETLIALVRQPSEMFLNPSLRPHGFYYCSRQLVPVLNRVLLLLGLDCKKWLSEVQERLLTFGDGTAFDMVSSDLMYFRRFCSEVLVGVGEFNLDEERRKESHASTTVDFYSMCGTLERRIHKLTEVCKACMGSHFPEIECVSFDCPVLFKLFKFNDKLSRTLVARALADSENA